MQDICVLLRTMGLVSVERATTGYLNIALHPEREFFEQMML